MLGGQRRATRGGAAPVELRRSIVLECRRRLVTYAPSPGWPMGEYIPPVAQALRYCYCGRRGRGAEGLSSPRWAPPGIACRPAFGCWSRVGTLFIEHVTTGGSPSAPIAAVGRTDGDPIRLSASHRRAFVGSRRPSVVSEYFRYQGEISRSPDALSRGGIGRLSHGKPVAAAAQECAGRPIRDRDESHQPRFEIVAPASTRVPRLTPRLTEGRPFSSSACCSSSRSARRTCRS